MTTFAAAAKAMLGKPDRVCKAVEVLDQDDPRTYLPNVKLATAVAKRTPGIRVVVHTNPKGLR